MRIGPDPAQVDLCVFFGHMRVAVCAGWGALRGTGVDAHAVLFLRALQLWYALLSMGWLFCRPRGWFYGRDATVAMQR